VGDRIAIFASGDIPFVLRQAHSDAIEEAYILIGGCYLDGKPFRIRLHEHMKTDCQSLGAMHGEAVYEEGKRAAERRHSDLLVFPTRRPWLEMMASLDLGCRADTILADVSPHQRHRVVKRTGSLDSILDSVDTARTKTVELAFENDLHLV
jgi:hypothetical protein